MSDPQAPAQAELQAVFCGENRGKWLQILTAAGFEWTQVRLAIPDLPQGLRGLKIVHISDLHLRGRWDPALDLLAQRVNASSPDLILFTGDFVDNKFDPRRAIGWLQKLISQLQCRLGMVGILGNHDGDLMAPILSEMKITLINHRRLCLASGSAMIELIGLAGVERFDLDLPYLASLPPKPPDAMRIVLSHFPDAILQTGFLQPDMYMCGHTHGGQICLPGGFPIFRHDTLPRKLCTGINRAFGTWMIVNRGMGFADIPIRLFCPAQTIEIQLECAAGAAR